tara:strand:- start:3037 stop:3690 length:654 start_codon:yes stop_codon:yes gene_type:complete
MLLYSCSYAKGGQSQLTDSAAKYMANITVIVLTEKKALEGDAKAQYDLGDMYEHGRGIEQDYKQAMEWYSKSAQQGYAWAHIAIAQIYYEGKGVAADSAKAEEWYNKAGELDDPEMPLVLGSIYYYGKHIGRNYSVAAKWYIKAAEIGYNSAYMSLGEMYSKGQGVAQDYVMAHMYYNLWGMQFGSSYPRDAIAKLMTKEQIYEAQKMAREWMEKHQ